MKYNKFAILLVLFLITAVGCSKKSTTTSSFTAGMSYKFNGTTKSPSLVVADYIKSQNTLQVSGSAGMEGLSILLENVKVGTFDIATDNVLAIYTPDTNIDHSYTGTTDSVVITSFTSTTVTGTFQFSGSTPGGTTGAVTEGKFSAKLITQ